MVALISLPDCSFESGPSSCLGHKQAVNRHDHSRHVNLWPCICCRRFVGVYLAFTTHHPRAQVIEHHDAGFPMLARAHASATGYMNRLPAGSLPKQTACHSEVSILHQLCQSDALSASKRPGETSSCDCSQNCTHSLVAGSIRQSS